MDSQVRKELRTWMPLKVFEDFTSFAKANTGTAMGKFDYATSIHILLMKSTILDHFLPLLEALEKRIEQLENQNQPSTTPVGYREVKTFADRNQEIKREVS